METVGTWLRRATGVGYTSPRPIEETHEFREMQQGRAAVIKKAETLADGLQRLENDLAQRGTRQRRNGRH